MLVSTLPGLVLPCQSGQQWTWGRHHSGCCRGSRSAQCCTWVFQCSKPFCQMSTFSTFIQGVDHLLEVQSHAPVLHGLVNTQQTSIPKLFKHLDSFCIYDRVWLKVHLCCWVHPLLLPLGDKWVDVLKRVDYVQNSLVFVPILPHQRSFGRFSASPSVLVQRSCPAKGSVRDKVHPTKMM